MVMFYVHEQFEIGENGGVLNMALCSHVTNICAIML